MRSWARTLWSAASEPFVRWLLPLSMAGWVLVAVIGRDPAPLSLCSPDIWRAWLPGGIGWTQSVGRDALLATLPATLAMLLAMTPLLLFEAVAHLHHRTLRRRRWRAQLCFAIGYAGVWSAAMSILWIAATVIRAMLEGRIAAIALVAMAALALWRALPWRQRCLDRCHRLPPLAPFGWRADRDALRFGLFRGGMCVGACWPWMWLPCLLVDLHLPAMAAAGVAMVVEQRRVTRASPRATTAPRTSASSRPDPISRAAAHDGP